MRRVTNDAAASGQPATSTTLDDRLRHASILVELGELYDAEAEVEGALEERPEDLTALDLLGKIKHMRGELSEAIACWTQVHEKAPREQGALIHLSSLLQFARESGRGPGNYVALGPFQFWKKPAALLELERAFRLFLEERPDEARKRCEEIARKYRATDVDVYKLAVLANAWIAELSGDLDSARSILESLGKDRGFETDSDRVLALARLYERIGTKELLEKAVNVYQHFERSYEKVSVLGHLTSLCRLLGRTQVAAGYERRFLELFRRRMHRPSFGDVVRTAAQHYLPLDKLGAVTFPDADRAAPDLPRERAISLALRHDRRGAAELLRNDEDALGLMYRGDLTALEGSFEKAIPLYLASLQKSPGDLRIIGALLEHHGQKPSRAVVDYFSRPETARATLERLDAALHASPLRSSLWRQLAAFHGIFGRTADSERCAKRAAALEDAAERARHPVGRVLAAAVYHLSGKPRGLVHEVWAARRPAERGRGGFLEEILGNLTPEMTQAVRNTFFSVREYARAKWPEPTRDILDYGYTYKVTKEDEPSGGLSAGLPSALAFLSVFLDKPVPQTIASTGALVADAHDVLVVKPVGEPEYKVRGAYNRNLAKILLPAGNRRELEGSALVPADVSREIVSFVSDLDEAVVHAFGKDVWLGYWRPAPGPVRSINVIDDDLTGLHRLGVLLDADLEDTVLHLRDRLARAHPRHHHDAAERPERPLVLPEQHPVVVRDQARTGDDERVPMHRHGHLIPADSGKIGVDDDLGFALRDRDRRSPRGARRRRPAAQHSEQAVELLLDVLGGISLGRDRCVEGIARRDGRPRHLLVEIFDASDRLVDSRVRKGLHVLVHTRSFSAREDRTALSRGGPVSRLHEKAAGPLWRPRPWH